MIRDLRVANIITTISNAIKTKSVVVRNSSTTDGVALAGRAGGTGTYEVTLTPTTLTADQTLTLPNASGTVGFVEPNLHNSADIGSSATYYRPMFVPVTLSTFSGSYAQGEGGSVPYIFQTPVVISEIGFRSGQTAATTTARISIYKAGSDNPAPITRVYESGNISVTTASTNYSLTGLSISLEPGMYWVFIWNSGSTTLYLQINPTNYQGSVNSHLVPFSSMASALTQANSNGGWKVAFGSGTSATTLVPFGATASTAVNPDSNWPRVAIRRST